MSRSGPRPRVVVLYRDPAGEWRYRHVAGNGQVIGASEEGFVDRAYALARAREEYAGVPVVERVNGRRVPVED